VIKASAEEVPPALASELDDLDDRLDDDPFVLLARVVTRVTARATAELARGGRSGQGLEQGLEEGFEQGHEGREARRAAL